MTHRLPNSRLDALRRSAPDLADREAALLYLVCIPAVMFSVLGLLFALNFGVSLIAVACAILYYTRFGQRVAAEMAAMLLVMLALWMAVMPAHHLVAASVGILLLAVGGRIFRRIRAGKSRLSIAAIRDRLLYGPVVTLMLLRDRLAKPPDFDPR